MFVRNYMTENPIVLAPKDDVNDAFSTLLENGVRQAPVVDNGELVGIVSDRDLRMAMVQNMKMNSLTVGFIMTKDPVTIAEDAKMTEACRLMGIGKFNAIPVTEQTGKLKGIISTTDIIKCFLDENEDENVPLITK